MNNLLRIACMTVLLTLAASAQYKAPAPGSSTDTASSMETLNVLLKAVRPPLTFCVDDEITVRILSVPDYEVKQRVADDGSIVLPLLGQVQVAGLTASQLQQQLVSTLQSKGIVVDPQLYVTAETRPSAVVTVSGAVNKPGVFPALGQLTLMDYISLAGGLEDAVPGASPSASPSGSTITLIRASLPDPLVVPLGPDPAHAPFGRIPVFPGDEIRVGKLGVVYAVGAFRAQGVFPLKSTSPLTVGEVVALAGGIGFEASARDARIVRAVGQQRTLIAVNVARILKGSSPDIPLMADDILFVPTVSFKAAIKGGGAGLTASIVSALLYLQH